MLLHDVFYRYFQLQKNIYQLALGKCFQQDNCQKLSRKKVCSNKNLNIFKAKGLEYLTFSSFCKSLLCSVAIRKHFLLWWALSSWNVILHEVEETGLTHHQDNEIYCKRRMDTTVWTRILGWPYHIYISAENLPGIILPKGECV